VSTGTGLFWSNLINIDHPRLPNWGMIRIMDMEAKELTRALLALGKELSFKEFASLLVVGNVRPNDAPAIPTEHSARLIALGYTADIGGRLRMTTPGRVRIAAGP
jgi:hypothetical protein